MKYQRAIELLTKVYEELPAGVELTKGGIGELALAHYLDHTLVDGDKGADGEDSEGKQYEYKISATNQYNFNFGGRGLDRSGRSWQDRIIDYMDKIEGAYCAENNGVEIVDCAYCDSQTLKEYLLNHFENSTGHQLNKNFSMNAFRNLGENSS